MNSKELNKKLYSLADKKDIYHCYGGKAIPYIGWFWRDVNFDSDHCILGVIPESENNIKTIGFMQNNKWDYDIIRIDGEKWNKLKSLLIVAINDSNRNNLKAVNDFMQGL